MQTLSRAALALVVLLISAAARSDGIQPGGLGFADGITGTGKVIPQPTGKILLVDGASFILQADGASKICIAGGC